MNDAQTSFDVEHAKGKRGVHPCSFAKKFQFDLCVSNKRTTPPDAHLPERHANLQTWP